MTRQRHLSWEDIANERYPRADALLEAQAPQHCGYRYALLINMLLQYVLDERMN